MTPEQEIAVQELIAAEKAAGRKLTKTKHEKFIQQVLNDKQQDPSS